MITIAYLCIIMTNGTIVLKIYLTLIFPRDKQKRKCTPSLEYIIYLEYIVHACPASFQNQNGGCVIRVYCSVSLALRNMGYGVSILPLLRWTVLKQKQRMNFTTLSLFRRIRHQNVCVPHVRHVQHDYHFLFQPIILLLCGVAQTTT